MPAYAWPTALPPGGTIGVVSPAGPVDRVSLQRGLSALERKGYTVRLGEHVLDRRHYLAGPDAARLADLHAAFADESIDAVWCARGGYGTMRLLPHLDWDLLARPVPLIGYSDITALQMALLTHRGRISLSGPMVASNHGYGHPEGMEPDTEAALFAWLQDWSGARPLDEHCDGRLRTLRGGRAAGPIVGGNLALFSALVGTPHLPELDGAILVIEDVGESPYRIDRMLTQLLLAGVFDRVVGMVLADFHDCFPPFSPDPGPPLEDMVLELVGDRPLPIVADLRYGHIRARCTVPLGAWLDVDADAPALVVHRDPPR